ncbi:serine protease [Streptomyces sp. NPDC020377]|uniref:serine protease n=1 Tax=Streptomyces sp. NPDC020377 TaxID=3365070 RepID=UPI00378ECFE1
MGTGFFVAPGVVATCAHVVAASAAELPRRIVGRIASRSLVLELQARPERYFLTPGDGLDLAFLQVTDADRRESPAALPLSDRLAVGDPLWTHGHPSGMFRAGQSATFTYEGTSARAFERPNSLHRLRGTVVTAEFSGSPVLNRRTGCVAGMLTTADRSGSSHMVGARELTARLDPDWCDSRWSADCRTWLGTLSDAQIQAGGWPFLGPQLREFLDISARAAREHPYPGGGPRHGASAAVHRLRPPARDGVPGPRSGAGRRGAAPRRRAPGPPRRRDRLRRTGLREVQSAAVLDHHRRPQVDRGALLPLGPRPGQSRGPGRRPALREPPARRRLPGAERRRAG